MQLPETFRRQARRARRLYALAGSSHRCYLCDRALRRFLPYRDGVRSLSPVTRALEVIGSDVENFACPACGCHDRERHLAMYFDRLDLWSRLRGATVLHFAPEGALSPRIAARNPASYLRADLVPATADVQRMDITRIPLADGSVDVVICNHVLEHIPDDRRALAELARVTRPGGIAVLQTPWSPLLDKMFSDPAVTSEELRNRLFGQEDHVRVYGHDLFRRIADAGFAVRRYSHEETLHGLDAVYFGVNAREDLVLATREPVPMPTTAPGASR